MSLYPFHWTSGLNLGWRSQYLWRVRLIWFSILHRSHMIMVEFGVWYLRKMIWEPLEHLYWALFLDVSCCPAGGLSVFCSNSNNRIQRRNSRFWQSPHCAANRLQHYAQAARVQSYANHVQHIERLSHATCCATWCEGIAQLLSLTELKSHLFELYFIGWIIKPMKEGRKPEYPEKTPGDKPV